MVSVVVRYATLESIERKYATPRLSAYYGTLQRSRAQCVEINMIRREPYQAEGTEEYAYHLT